MEAKHVNKQPTSKKNEHRSGKKSHNSHNNKKKEPHYTSKSVKSEPIPVGKAYLTYECKFNANNIVFMQNLGKKNLSLNAKSIRKIVNKLKVNDKALEKEFKELQASRKDFPVSQNGEKQKSDDSDGSLIPYEYNAIKLHNTFTSSEDYINASYISGINNKIEFIASQVPTNKTAKKFWEMVYENHVKVIINVENYDKNSSLHKFWPPPAKSVELGKLSVALVKKSDLGSNLVRIVELTPKNPRREKLKVKVCNLNDWDDLPSVSLNNYLMGTIHLCKMASDDPQTGPVIVQSINGSHKVFVLIAATMLLQQYELHEKMNIKETCVTLINQRKDALSSIVEYSLIYKLADLIIKSCSDLD